MRHDYYCRNRSGGTGTTAARGNFKKRISELPLSDPLEPAGEVPAETAAEVVAEVADPVAAAIPAAEDPSVVVETPEGNTNSGRANMGIIRLFRGFRNNHRPGSARAGTSASCKIRTLPGRQIIRGSAGNGARSFIRCVEVQNTAVRGSDIIQVETFAPFQDFFRKLCRCKVVTNIRLLPSANTICILMPDAFLFCC